MIYFLSFSILALLAAGFALILWQQNRIIVDLRRSRDQIRGEEHRMFDFLHGLGLELQNDYTASNMHRYAVEGIIRVLESNGAGLYMLSSNKKRLNPAFISGGCPPLISLPEAVVDESEQKPSAVTNYIRLQSIAADHPIFGQALTNHKVVRIDDLSKHPEFRGKVTPRHRGLALMIGPLVYAGKALGLLVVARHETMGPFSGNEMALFSSLTEQSAFALGSAILHKEAHDKKLLDAELRTASEFQRILLPKSAPKLAKYDIAGVNFPAKIVSGDYFDYVMVDDDHLGVAIADVSGKGVPASLIMATCRSVLRAKAASGLSPSEVLKVVNAQIFPDIREDMFITMAYLILDDKSNMVTFSRAGHNPPYVYRAKTGTIEAIEPVGMAVGIDSGGVFDRIVSDYEFMLSKGDVLLLYTDGVNEAENELGIEFGEDAIKDALKEFSDHTAEGIISRLCDKLRAFVGGADQSDDITLIAIKKG